MFMYKQDLASNNLQELICHKTQQNQILYMYVCMYVCMYAYTGFGIK